jgi:hypothetical protein
MREVERKQKHWADLSKKKRQAAMAESFFPSVKGPHGAHYILDHHHLALALLREKSPEVQVGLVKDLSVLDPDEFWIYLDHLSWVHPYDQRGRRRSFREMPRTLDGMRDDPYRSLAGEVRDAGGFGKSYTPFLEFLWTNFFRQNVSAKMLAAHHHKAIKQAMRLARSKDSQYLPGWVGAAKD